MRRQRRSMFLTCEWKANGGDKISMRGVAEEKKKVIIGLWV